LKILRGEYYESAFSFVLDPYVSSFPIIPALFTRWEWRPRMSIPPARSSLATLFPTPAGDGFSQLIDLDIQNFTMDLEHQNDPAIEDVTFEVSSVPYQDETYTLAAQADVLVTNPLGQFNEPQSVELDDLNLGVEMKISEELTVACRTTHFMNNLSLIGWHKMSGNNLQVAGEVDIPVGKAKDAEFTYAVGGSVPLTCELDAALSLTNKHPDCNTALYSKFTYKVKENVAISGILSAYRTQFRWNVGNPGLRLEFEL